MPDHPDTLLTLYRWSEPVLLATWGLIVPALVGWALMQLQTRTGIRVNESLRAKVQQAAINAGGRVLAAQEGPIAGLRFDADHPAIAREVGRVQAVVQPALDALGVTPEALANLIVAKVGILQAGAGASAGQDYPVGVESPAMQHAAR